MTALTPEQRQQWRTLADAATPGPWTLMGGMKPGVQRITNGAAVVIAETFWGGEGDGPDAAFIAAAREAVPALLDALDAAEAERDDAREAYGRMEQRYERERAWATDYRAQRDEARAEVARLREREARVRALCESDTHEVDDGEGNVETFTTIVYPYQIRAVLDGEA